MTTSVSTTQQGGFDLSPTTMKEALEFSKMLADSALVPKDYQGRPGNVLVAIQWGMELGLKPMQAMQNIAVINGRPSVWGDAVLALVLASPVCEDVEEYFEGEGEKLTAHCIAKRKGRKDVHQVFSISDARTAGLFGNKQGPWVQYPRRMLQMRARGFALRDQFADVLKGMPIAEEVMDIPAERDITPTAATTSRANSIKAKLAAPAAPAITIETITAGLAGASTPEDMAAIKAQIGSLPEAEQKAATTAFSKRLKELKAAQAPEPASDPLGAPTVDEALALVRDGFITEARDVARSLSEGDQAVIEQAIEQRG